jgi:hypothetical protein
MGKSSKKCCASVCETNCCKPDCEVDCCSAAFLRLDKLRQGWSDLAASNNQTLAQQVAVSYVGGITGSVGSATAAWFPATLINRAGTTLAVPVGGSIQTLNTSIQTFTSLWGNDAGVVNPITFAVTGANNTANGALPATYNIVTDTVNYSAPEQTVGSVSIYNNFLYAYNFVNTHRYQAFEACGKADQVVGWYVNTQTGQLELFQALPDLSLTVADDRYSLIIQETDNLSGLEKQQLYALNVLYKLSVKAIERIGANPKEEGNICEFTDKCGQKWLLAINRANSNTSVANLNTEFVIVGVPLC